MMYEFVVALTVFAHFLFIAYVVVGGFLALRWRRTIGLHAVAVLWAVASTFGHVGCPLTGLERWARQRAGMHPLPSEGFIAHYITGVLYPADWVAPVQAVVFSIVATTWAWFVWRGRRRQPKVYDADRPISSSGEL